MASCCGARESPRTPPQCANRLIFPQANMMGGLHSSLLMWIVVGDAQAWSRLVTWSHSIIYKPDPLGT